MDQPAQIDDHLLRELMSSLSHDLRNPLAAVVTNLAFSKGLGGLPLTNQDVAEALDDSIIACDVMQMIVANLDLIIRGSFRQSTLHLVTVAATVKEVVKRIETRTAQAHVTIRFEEPEIRLQALLDRTHFALAVENLISNTVVHSPKSSTIRISVASEGPDLCVHFDDQGIIIPPPLRTFAVSAMSHTRAGRRSETRYSRGLGLLSASRAAILAGATLELTSVDEGWNRFTLRAPRQGFSELIPD